MVAKARDARLLRALLQLDPPRGVTRRTWRTYLQQKVAPPVRAVLRDLGQPVAGPVAEPEDLHATTAAPSPRVKAARRRRSVTIREDLARAVERGDKILGESLDERVDALLTIALATHPHLRRPA